MKIKMKQFNLEEAKSGNPVCIRDGNDARIICFDAKTRCDKPIVALILFDGYEEEFLLDKDGALLGIDDPSEYDLMMKD